MNLRKTFIRCGEKMDEHDLPSQIARLSPSIKYHGVYRNSGSWRDFRVGNALFPFDPIYGHRLAKNAALFLRRSRTSGDLCVTDADGFVPNELPGTAARQRIAAAKRANQKVILVYGGSTIFGYGAGLPEQTIPAHLERCLNAQYGFPCIVVNCGNILYATDQQVLYLLEEGLELKPDIVIFYDGWNDNDFLNGMLTYHGADYVPGRARQSYRMIERQQTLMYFFPAFRQVLKLGFRLLVETMEALPFFGWRGMMALNRWCRSFFFHPLTGEYTATEYQPRSVERYAYNILTAAALCRTWEVDFLHFTQPILLLAGKSQTKEEQSFIAGFNSEYCAMTRNFFSGYIRRDFPFAAEFARQVRQDHDLSGVFNQTAESVFIDPGHLNGRGNAIVAQAIADHLVKRG
ncbi:MAG: hypothetical protein HQL23_00960 [Candidatus Omnitrophica bacterium]|nr:hypothetical protein [Candidatus Omnitrophota bacterium]